MLVGIETGGSRFLAWGWTLSLATIAHVVGSVWATASFGETHAGKHDNGMVSGPATAADVREGTGTWVASRWSVETKEDGAVLGGLQKGLALGQELWLWWGLEPVSIKHGLRTGYKIRTRYKTRTRKYGLGIKHGQGIKRRLRTADWV